MKPTVFLQKSIDNVRRRFRVGFFSTVCGEGYAKIERTGAEDASPHVHTSRGILLKGGYVLSTLAGPDGVHHVDTTFSLPVNYTRGNGRLMFLSVREYLSKRRYLRQADDVGSESRFFIPPHIWSDNYYHFIVEVLPSIQWALSHTDLPILVPGMKPFLQRFLDHFGNDWQTRVQVFDPSTLVRGTFHGLTNIRILRKGTYTLPNPRLLQFYREASATSSDAPETVLVVSRSLTGDRRILNEDAMVEYISARFPCEVLLPEREGFASQLAKLHRARVIVGSHGAGLTNMIFHARLACLVEVVLQSKVNESYISLCEAIGVSHRWLVVEGSRQEGEGPIHALVPVKRRNFTLGTIDFERLLQIVAEGMGVD
ncbi:MAG: glycosyltransferase family 61 protein [Chitinophagia bacterium]|nr:glycosyltransferase family 61 protein [Chitinophagia bacterium]